MNKLKLWLGIGCVFILGILAGYFGRGWYRHVIISRFLCGGRESIVQRIMEKYDRELGLSSEQHAAVENIVRQSREELDQSRQKSRVEEDAVIARRLQRIEEHLTPEQQGRLEKMCREKSAKNRRHKSYR